jgi:hypothetical protein
VNAKNPVAIDNAKAGSAGSPGNFLIYFDRNVGGYIGWPDITRWESQLVELGPRMGWTAAKKLVPSPFGIG